jgi:glycosyltransferase involved in cell wall biosynthesis
MVSEVVKLAAVDETNSSSEGILPTQAPENQELDGVELTILMPCLNERDAIVACVHEAQYAIELANMTGEVLVIDNGSSDGSPELASIAGARVIQEPKKGYGNAYLCGFQEARGKYIIIGDSDGTYDFTLVPQFLSYLRQGYDFVNGSRTKGQIEPGAMPFLHRYIGVPILSWILNRLCESKLSDAHCGMRGFSRDAVEKMGLRTPGMEFASEIILQAARTNLKIAELPIPYRTREGKSKLRTFRDGWRHLRFMLLYSPSHLFLLPGIAGFSIGFLMLLGLVWGGVQVGGVLFDIHYMVAGSLVALLGYQLLALGVYGRAYATSVGILKKDGLLEWGRRYLTLERGLAVGGAVTAIGAGILTWILMTWVIDDFSFKAGPHIRPALLGLTLVLIGVQTMFSAFFLSLLTMETNIRPGWRAVGI